jgi:5-methylcytosine-specific restriction endonuclease McrA
VPHADPAARAAYRREWKRRNPGRYKAEAKIYDAMTHANERAEKYGAPGRLTQDDVRDVLAIGSCHYCGTSERLGIDHVQPLHSGGANQRDNLVPACHSCNASKWRQDRPRRWAREHDRCVDCSTTERKHLAKGMCTKCHRRDRASHERAERAA